MTVVLEYFVWVNFTCVLKAMYAIACMHMAGTHELFFMLLPLAYDCPLFKGVYDYCSLVGGASVTAAKCLLQKEATVAINWYGGWHHAGR